MGINTNIMFPPPDVSVLRIVDNISRSGSLYAVVITSQNYYHKSCTLNVLHGAPQGIFISGLNPFILIAIAQQMLPDSHHQPTVTA